MIEVSKNNPVLKLENDVKNFSFATVDGVTYLIANTINGDVAYAGDETIKAGEFLNGYDLTAWENQILVIDAKHLDDEIDKIDVDDEITIADDYLVGEGLGDYTLVCAGKTILTEGAVKARIVYGATGETGETGETGTTNG